MLLKSLLKFYLVAIGLIALFTGCSGTTEIKGFDQEAWQQDVRSCNNIRPGLLPALKKAIPQLIGLRHNKIIQVLGKPEGNSLEKSGERVYYYFIEPGAQCKNQTTSEANKVLVRFDALDRVYKVRLEKEF